MTVSLNRIVEIRARRATVFRFFTDSVRFARWWGDGSSIDASIGGPVKIRYPNGATASGEVRAIEPDRMIAFTYGYDDPAKSIPPGGSLVTITLEDAPGGTRLELRHDVADAKTRDEHVPGWRYQLAVFARIVAEDAFDAAPIDAWFAAWNEAATERRRELLATAVTADVGFRDANGCTAGLDELIDHIAAVMQFMPGVRLEARGAPRHSHATVLADWAAVAGGHDVMTGTNVFRVVDGRIAEVIGVPGR